MIMDKVTTFINWALDMINAIVSKTTRTKFLVTLVIIGIAYILIEATLPVDARMSVLIFGFACCVAMGYMSSQSPIDVEITKLKGGEFGGPEDGGTTP